MLDDAAVAAIRDLYSDLGIDGRVLDLCAGSAEHFDVPPDELVAFDGDPDDTLPFGDQAFDDVICANAVGTITRPREAFAEVARVLRPGGRFVCTFAGARSGIPRLDLDRRHRPRADRARLLPARARVRPGRERPADVAHGDGRPPVGGVGF